ncbi:hypothetical protein BWQ96_08261 [Gracilariopsis chorda]|uniref:Uncharacterized protein n=1 Tax=Gracilariopsis chorda TaxID=448386 RepID=A0A2V3IIW2_9FLOR|nr:hypothetical protein BWQ96_08261 [Gracilariopsis chorda]|eukprot:PXF42011.1 hypothetical protein BWQ96_08261 [Gracilariopsis chorda]
MKEILKEGGGGMRGVEEKWSPVTQEARKIRREMKRREEGTGRGEGVGSRLKKKRKPMAGVRHGEKDVGPAVRRGEELVQFQSAVDVARTNERLIGEQEERHMTGMGSFGARRVFENGDSFPMNLSEMTFKEMETQDWNA